MNFDDGEPSNNQDESLSSSLSLSSFSSDDDDSSALLMRSLIANQAALHSVIQNNNSIMHHHYHNMLLDQPVHGGSVPGRRTVFRDRESAHRNLVDDYFSQNPLYDKETFHRRFRMHRHVYLRIVEAVKAHDPYFVQQEDGFGRHGLSSLQKITAAFRMLAYGVPADATDEYIKIGESTAIEGFKKFCRAIVEIFSERYLRSPNANDIAKLLHIGHSRGFPGMLGSLDCMHWEWKNCPTSWTSQFAGRSGTPSMILEAVADYDLWIWHAYFGMPGSNNDINVLNSSPLFNNLSKGITPPTHYVIQEKEYDTGYYLADGRYPKWSTLVQTIRNPQGPKKKYFAMKQEACRKDVERAFGVLQTKFEIIKGPGRFWKKNVLRDIMTTCIIMHNMIIEDERDLSAPIGEARQADASTVDPANDPHTFQKFMGRYNKIKDKTVHLQLREALIEHLWDKYSNS